MSTGRQSLAVIPARGGSKGVPRKNIRLLAGKPLIAYAIETALASRLIDRVVVSTEDEEIAGIARQYGAEVPFLRPKELARDDSPEWLTWQHAIRTLTATENSPRIDVFVCVSPTAPLRSVDDLDACIGMLTSSDADLVVTVKPAERNPYFNMMTLNEAGYAELVIPPPRDGVIYRRQDAPKVYDMTTVAYAVRPTFVLSANAIFDGVVRGVVVPQERALDIDTEFDMRIAACLLAERASEGTSR